MTLRTNLKKYRKKKNFNQKDLSERSGVSFSMVSKLETGEQSNPSLDVLNKLAKSLDVEVNQLLENELADDVKRYEVFSKFFNEDVGKYLTFMIEQLDSGNPNLLFEGEELDEENQKLLKESLQTNYNIIKKLNS